MVVALNALHLVFAAKHQANALVQRGGHDAQHGHAAGAGAATGLLHDHADGVGLVQQAQAAGLAGVLGVARVHEHAAAHQNAVRFGHHAGNPAHVEVFAPGPGFACQALVHIALHRRFPEAAVGRVDGKFLRVGRDLDVVVRQLELAQVGVEREAVDAVAHGEHQHGGGAVQRVARRQLLGTGLEEVFGGDVAAAVDHVLRRPQNGKDAAHRHVHVDVAGAIQRVKHQQVFAARVLARNLIRLVHFFRAHARQVAAPVVGADEHVVADHVQLLLRFALHVDAGAAGNSVVVAQHAAEFTKGHRAGNGFAGQRHVQNQGVEVAAGTGEAPALLDQELGQRGAFGQRHGGLSVVF